MGSSYQKRHGEEWRYIGRSKAWHYKEAGEPEVARILRGKFNFHLETHYNAATVGFDIVTEVWSMDPRDPLDPILRHAESYSEFPSDHLMTKLILLVG